MNITQIDNAENPPDSLRFLTALATPYVDSRSARLELRCFMPGAQRTGRRAGGWYPLTPDGLGRAAVDAERWGANLEVYVGVLPRRDHIGDASGLRRCGWLWADIDGGDDGPEGARALLTTAVAERGLPRPHVLILSGGGLHCYWRLAEPAPVRDTAEQDRIRKTLRRLVRLIGGNATGRDGMPCGPGAHADRASAEPARILRVPGTFNRKRDPARPVRLLRCAAPSDAAPMRPLVWWCAHLPAEPLPPRIPLPGNGQYRRPFRNFQETGELPPTVLAKLTAPAAHGARHYTMVDVAVWARKQGQDPAAIRSLAEQAARTSGVAVDDYREQRHLDSIVEWTMRSVQPDYATL